jgi:flagellum-specific peptidoglycan hydrolase FlgJ
MKKDFLNRIRPLAEAEQKISGIHPDITVTQAAHESRWGDSGLAVKANNLFGKTAGKLWLDANYPVVEMETWEFSPLPPEKIQYWNRPGDIKERKVRKSGGTDLVVLVPFRKFASWPEAIRDWAEAISLSKRYAKAYEVAKSGNFEQYAKEVAAAGYATDPKYAEKLIKVYQEVKSL